MQVISERGQEGNTLVIVTSDKGAPMIFADGGDGIVHAPICLTDVLPTVATGMVAEVEDGVNQLPAQMYLRLQDICADESNGLAFGVPL